MRTLTVSTVAALALLSGLAHAGATAPAPPAAVAAPAPAPAPEMSVDEIVQKNIAARGGMEKIKAITSLRSTGKMLLGPGVEAPMLLEVKRPGSFRMEFTFQGMTATTAFDGKSGWMVMPFMGKKDPEPMPEEETKQAAEQADFDGFLVDYKQKGNTIEYVGKETVDGTDAYKLKVTLKSGDVRYDFLDAETFLEVRTEGKRVVQGQEREFEGTMSDYKPVAGVMMPYAIENGVKGMPQKAVMTMEKIEANVPLDDARFKMPAKPSPTPAPAAKP